MTKPTPYYAYNLRRRVYDGELTGVITTGTALGYKGQKDRSADEVLVEKEQYDELRARILNVVKYCRPHTDKMWAASIIGILLNCDFRDAELEAERIEK